MINVKKQVKFDKIRGAGNETSQWCGEVGSKKSKSPKWIVLQHNPFHTLKIMFTLVIYNTQGTAMDSLAWDIPPDVRFRKS
jgi:hypothetical protein